KIARIRRLLPSSASSENSVVNLTFGLSDGSDF
ncbi:MAG: hypothetical protein ACI9X0_002405, partial [Kiritimatiellia bacterium]